MQQGQEQVQYQSFSSLCLDYSINVKALSGRVHVDLDKTHHMLTQILEKITLKTVLFFLIKNSSNTIFCLPIIRSSELYGSQTKQQPLVHTCITWLSLVNV